MQLSFETQRQAYFWRFLMQLIAGSGHSLKSLLVDDNGF